MLGIQYFWIWKTLSNTSAVWFCYRYSKICILFQAIIYLVILVTVFQAIICFDYYWVCLLMKLQGVMKHVILGRVVNACMLLVSSLISLLVFVVLHFDVLSLHSFRVCFLLRYCFENLYSICKIMAYLYVSRLGILLEVFKCGLLLDISILIFCRIQYTRICSLKSED